MHQEKVKETFAEMRGFENEKSALIDEGKGDGRLKVISYGECPIMPSKDRRKSMAMAGAMRAWPFWARLARLCFSRAVIRFSATR